MFTEPSVKDHTRQADSLADSSHATLQRHGFITWPMDVSETFRRNLLALLAEKKISAATLSKAAGLNARAVKDIEERRTQSPKLSTVFALADALGVDAGALMGLPPRPRLVGELVAFLEQLDAAQQERLLAALAALPPPRS